MAENTRKPGADNPEKLLNDDKDTLNINDILTDDNDALAEYFSVSVSNDGHDTTINAATLGSNAHVEQTIITGMTATDLSEVIKGIEHDIPDTDIT